MDGGPSYTVMARSLVLSLALSFTTSVSGANVTLGLLTLDQSETLVLLQMAGNPMEEWNCLNLEVHCFLLNILLVNDANENVSVLPNVNLQLEISQLADSCDSRQLIQILKRIVDSGVVTTFTPECDISPSVANVYSKKIQSSLSSMGYP